MLIVVQLGVADGVHDADGVFRTPGFGAQAGAEAFLLDTECLVVGIDGQTTEDAPEG